MHTPNHSTPRASSHTTIGQTGAQSTTRGSSVVPVRPVLVGQEIRRAIFLPNDGNFLVRFDIRQYIAKPVSDDSLVIRLEFLRRFFFRDGEDPDGFARSPFLDVRGKRWILVAS